MQEHSNYHELGSAARDLFRAAVAAGRALIGHAMPHEAPKQAVDYSGKPQSQVEAVQLVITGFPEIERTDTAQLGRTAQNRWDDMGNYHE